MARSLGDGESIAERMLAGAANELMAVHGPGYVLPTLEEATREFMDMIDAPDRVVPKVIRGGCVHACICRLWGYICIYICIVIIFMYGCAHILCIGAYLLLAAAAVAL
jgi:hypothetical protein